MASSGSTVSLQKSSCDRRTSCGTLCSSNSSCCVLQKRKTINPLARPLRTTVNKSNTGNAVIQRVLSAKQSRMRLLQNQLNDANFHLIELAKENRALKTLQKRQDKALSRYEDTNADLPRLLKSHEDEIRTLKERNKAMRKNIKDLTDQIKNKDEEVLNLREQLKHILELSKDKRLGEREKLSAQVHDLQDKLKSSEEQVSLLNRKLVLETKNLKYRLNQEVNKNRLAQKELDQAFKEIDRLGNLVDKKERQIISSNKMLPQRHVLSMASLTESTPEVQCANVEVLQEENVEIITDNSSSVKLEPISPRKEDNEQAEKIIKSILKSPSECIKERLSADSISEMMKPTLKSPTEVIKERLSIKIQKDESVSSFSNKAQSEKSIYTITRKRNRPSSSHKLEKISDHLQSTIQKTEEKDTLGKHLGDYCTDVVESFQECNKMIDKHREEYESAKNETEKLLKSLRDNDKLDSKLRLHNILAKDILELPDQDQQLAERILEEEYSFQNSLKNEDAPSKGTDKNGNVVEPTAIRQDDKQKLLATLQAIDKGEEIETITNNTSIKTKLMKDLFGDLKI